VVSSAQISESKFIENMEWINLNPSQSDNDEFVSKSAELITFHVYNYSNFYINNSGTKELEGEWDGNPFKEYFFIVYSYNQLNYKLLNKKFNKVDACTFSMKKLIESYMIVIKNNPKLRIKTLDEYSKLNESDLQKKIKKLVK